MRKRRGSGFAYTLRSTSRAAASSTRRRLSAGSTALETTIDLTKARTELGYAPVQTIADGMAELRALQTTPI